MDCIHVVAAFRESVPSMTGEKGNVLQGRVRNVLSGMYSIIALVIALANPCVSLTVFPSPDKKDHHNGHDGADAQK